MSQTAASQSYRLGITTVNVVFTETINAIWECLSSTFLPLPSEETWKESAAKFETKWQFPNCIGAIDGKHVQIRVSAKDG